MLLRVALDVSEFISSWVISSDMIGRFFVPEKLSPMKPSLDH
jgi:hypothetical protein